MQGRSGYLIWMFRQGVTKTTHLRIVRNKFLPRGRFNQVIQRYLTQDSIALLSITAIIVYTLIYPPGTLIYWHGAATMSLGRRVLLNSGHKIPCVSSTPELRWDALTSWQFPVSWGMAPGNLPRAKCPSASMRPWRPVISIWWVSERSS